MLGVCGVVIVLLLGVRGDIGEFALVEMVVILLAIDVLDSYRGLLDMLLHNLSCKVLVNISTAALSLMYRAMLR